MLFSIFYLKSKVFQKYIFFSISNIFIVFSSFLKAQESLETKYHIYENDFLPASFFKERREKLRELLPKNSVAVIFSAPIQRRSSDVYFKYHQNPNLYYFTGYNEPNAVLFIFKNEINIDSIKTNEIFFVEPNDPELEKWTGYRLGVEGTKELLKVKTVFSNKDFSKININLKKLDSIFVIFPKSYEDDKDNPGDLASLVKHFKTKIKNKKFYEDQLKQMIWSLREIKQKEEIFYIQKAIDITCDALKKLMNLIEPYMTEFQAEAIIEYTFMYEGAEYPAFPSIIGSGENSCILHYESNRRTMKKGDLLVVDIGAEYHNYAADVTRTIPVSGKFSKEQRKIYDIVLAAQKAALEKCMPGNKFWDPHEAAFKVISNELKKLGIVKNKFEALKYFMHGTSHYLGLDVHDVGLYGPLKPGNIITVEPGIYIPENSKCDPKWWNIGIRIEDDVLITAKGHQVLSNCIPREAKEIEAIIGQ